MIRDFIKRTDEPGFYRMDAATYHSDCCNTPSLSSSVAKVLLSATPRHAMLAHPRLNPDFEPDDAAKFDLGKVAHELALGKGGGFRVLNYADYRTKNAKEARDDAIAAGLTPILAEQHLRAEAVAETILREIGEVPGCEGFMAPDAESELVAIFRDIGGPVCRVMFDRIHIPTATVFDLKCTERGLSDGEIQRAIDAMGYDVSLGLYVRALDALLPELAGRWRWVWLFAEADEPHEVRAIEADRATMEIGDRKAALAVERWRDCLARHEWPGYPRQVTRLGLTDYAISRWTEREMIEPDINAAAFSSSLRPIERKSNMLPEIVP